MYKLSDGGKLYSVRQMPEHNCSKSSSIALHWTFVGPFQVFFITFLRIELTPKFMWWWVVYRQTLVQRDYYNPFPVKLQ